MNSSLNNNQLQNTIRIARSSLLLLIVCCCVIIGNTAFAQYPDSSSYSSAQYQADIEETDNGGGTWGEILKMNARIEGSDAIFSITSKKGPFYNANSVSVRSGSHTGPIIASGKVPPGSEAARLRLDLSAVASFPHHFFATITNNIGYAWVGPIQISKNETATREPVPWDDSQPVTQQANDVSGPQRPVISETPERTEINAVVNITVTAGQTHSNDMVRVQCTASNSDNTPSSPYRSSWIYSGDSVTIPLTFHSTGTQAIFCNTLDSYGTTSSLSQRTITVAPDPIFSVSPAPMRELYSTPPAPAPRRDLSRPVPLPLPLPARKRITSTPEPLVEVPDQGSVNDPISITLIAGHDPQNRDLVRIGCTADDSNRTAADPYLSDWLPPEAETKGMFTFYSPGEKNIYCTSLSRHEVASPSTRKTISIRYDNQAPSQPEINEYPYNTSPGKTTYISVTAGSDPDGDMVKVQCSAKDSNITGNAPYVSNWVAPQSTVTAALVFYTSGDQEISCVTIDRKNAQSDKATRKIHVHSPQYNPGYSPEHNFNNTSSTSPSGSQSCGCKQKNTSSYPMKSNARQEGSITFNQPYIPDYSNPEYLGRPSVFQAPEPQPDIKGRVVYRSNGSPAQNALIKIWDAISGRAYTATTDYNGGFTLNFIQKNFTGQIQATKGADTSVIREVQIKADEPTIIDLIIMDREPAQSMQQTQPQWSPPQSQWPAKQAAPPAHNSVWQFN